MSKGTPNSLDQAIIETLMDEGSVELAPKIRLAVTDYIAQKFTCSILKAKTDDERESFKVLWEKITGNKIGGDECNSNMK